MPVLTSRDLRRVYGTQVVLEGVSVSVHAGERVGLVGRNGSGKTTLARLLAGVEEPDGGDVARRRDARIEYLAQEPVFDGETTAKEAALEGLADWRRARARYDSVSERIASGEGDLDAALESQAQAANEVERLGGWELEHRAEAVLGHLGVRRVDQPVGTMSGGERRRVALARVLVARPDLAILDEPTNHLDADTVDWLERHLADEFPGALLLVTHDRYLLDRVVTRTLELDRGTVCSYDGGWEAYLVAKAERLAHEARTEANRQNYLRTELEWLRRKPKARTGKQKARVQRIEAAKQSKPTARDEQVELGAQSVRTGGTILELHGLALELGGERLVEGLDLALTRGERVGIVGPNGAGKTTLLRAIEGELEPAAGEVVLGARTRIAYLAQSRASLDDEATVQHNVAGERTEVDFHGRTMDIRTYLGRFLFERDRLRQPVGSLSGGERARVALARLLLRPANLLLLDEPTNDLDVDTLAALEQMLVGFAGVALVVTHDRYFLDRIATSILAFEGDGRVVRYAGDYSTYRSLREQAGRERAGRAPAKRDRAEQGAATRVKSAQRTGLSWKEQRELEALEPQVEQAEAEVARLESELSDPSVYAERGDEVPALVAELERAKARAGELMARWEQL
ncbi:MAG: ABC-F family ATP-binding cassette domain-containing protein, partial [Polyangiales bacterium]